MVLTPFVRTAISYQDNDENRKIWKEAKMLALKDGWSLSRLVHEALLEYIKRHSPGNPQLALVHWTELMPMPESVRESAEKKVSSEWKAKELQEKQKGEERWAKLQNWTNEELIARQAKLGDREGTYMERLEISMILMHRRLSSDHGSVSGTLT